MLSQSIHAQEVVDDDLSSDTVVHDIYTIYRLFSPIHYDKSVTGRLLSLQGDSCSMLDRTLMYTYLTHPALVGKVFSTESTRGKLIAPNTQPDMVSQMKKFDKELDKKSYYPIDDSQLFSDEITMVVTKPDFWKFSGDYSLQFMQNYISPNWYNSGNSNYSMLGTVTLLYNYNNKQKVKWENKLEMRLGFLTTDADTVNHFKASDDLVRYTTQLSLQAYHHWYYAMQLVASTQFTKGLKNNDRMVYSDFMSPFNLNVSLGMNYAIESTNKKLTGDVLLAPLSYKLTYCDRVEISQRFGIDAGKRSLNDIGSIVNATVTWKPLDNFKWESRFYAFSNTNKFQLEWENTLTFQFNKYISAKLYVYPRFDDSAVMVDNTYWQLKENMSLGFAYSM